MPRRANDDASSSIEHARIATRSVRRLPAPLQGRQGSSGNGGRPVGYPQGPGTWPEGQDAADPRLRGWLGHDRTLRRGRERCR